MYRRELDREQNKSKPEEEITSMYKHIPHCYQSRIGWIQVILEDHQVSNLGNDTTRITSKC